MMNEKAQKLRSEIWESYRTRELKNEKRISELENKAIKFGKVTMRHSLDIIGKPDKNGYPVVIALHGGGGSKTPDMNDSQWEHMKIYYKNSLKNGIYVAARGVRDTWDTHANPESFPIYDELIENLILFHNADPNRVYIMGFSAGGDGVYIISPRMADRFAAANMSAGCPNHIKLENLRNLPFIIQAGEKDAAYRRNELIAEYDAYLDELQKKYGGFVHEAYIHFDRPHNFRDEDDTFAPKSVMKNNQKWLTDSDRTVKEVNTNAVALTGKYVRNPIPTKVVWNMHQRAKLREQEYFYWLKTAADEKFGRIVAEYDRETNSIIIDQSTVKNFSVMVNEEMLDLDREINVVIKDKTIELVSAPENKVDENVIRQTTEARGDKNYQFCCEYKFARK